MMTDKEEFGCWKVFEWFKARTQEEEVLIFNLRKWSQSLLLCLLSDHYSKTRALFFVIFPTFWRTSPLNPRRPRGSRVRLFWWELME